MISMGYYLFDFETIARELQADALTEGSSHDFGHDVIRGSSMRIAFRPTDFTTQRINPASGGTWVRLDVY